MKYAERLFSRPAFIDALTASEKGMTKIASSSVTWPRTHSTKPLL